MNCSPYELVRLRNGAVSVRSTADGETMHPAIGPAAEAEQLYVKQLRIADRLASHSGEFVVWDVGLGAAANAIAVLNAAGHACGAPVFDPASSNPPAHDAGPEADAPSPVRYLDLVSFDSTLEPLQFALRHVAELDYLHGREALLSQLPEQGCVAFHENGLPINWRVHVGDFPMLISRARRGGELPVEFRNPKYEIRNRREPLQVGCCGEEGRFPAPHAILFDPFSPAKNPEMWTVPLFADLFRFLDPERSCSLATYSRSTMVRVALLLAGFFVGVGHPSGQKEETTIAANKPELVDEPLDRRWLERARRSEAAEPLWEPAYRREKLSLTTWEELRAHPQFR